MSQGYGGNTNPLLKLNELEQAMIAMQGQHSQLAGYLRKVNAENVELSRKVAELSGFRSAVERIQIGSMSGGPPGKRHGPMAKSWGGNSLISLDQLQGRCYPVDMTVDIPIGTADTSPQTGTIYITPEGPFVAVARYAIFRSTHSFNYTSTSGTSSQFFSRSFGRFRPTHSAWDIMDAQKAFEQLSQYQPSFVGGIYDGTNIIPVANPAGIHPAAAGYAASADITNQLPNFPGTGRPIVASPITQSAFRTMQFDGLITVETGGSNFLRQNQRVPSAFWTSQINSPQNLGCFDVFEPGETITLQITPTHPNNPDFGNISSLVARNDDFTYDQATGGGANDPLPAGSWPFKAGQFDGHEGINDETLSGDTAVTSDRVQRSATGVLTIGYMGYRIVQGPEIVQ